LQQSISVRRPGTWRLFYRQTSCRYLFQAYSWKNIILHKSDLKNLTVNYDST
jgi:hypothetical protein